MNNYDRQSPCIHCGRWHDVDDTCQAACWTRPVERAVEQREEAIRKADLDALNIDWQVEIGAVAELILKHGELDRHMASTLEHEFMTRLIQLAPDAPAPVAEYRFHPKRKWRFDFAFTLHKVAVELEGGVYSNGRHTRGRGFVLDCHKYNAATALGWKVLRFTGDMLRDDPAACIELVMTCLEERG